MEVLLVLEQKFLFTDDKFQTNQLLEYNVLNLLVRFYVLSIKYRLKPWVLHLAQTL